MTLFCRPSFREEMGADLTKASVAEAAHHHQMFDAPESAVALSVLDDARRQRGADARHFFQFPGGRRVDIQTRRERGGGARLRTQRHHLFFPRGSGLWGRFRAANADRENNGGKQEGGLWRHAPQIKLH